MASLGFPESRIRAVFTASRPACSASDFVLCPKAAEIVSDILSVERLLQWPWAL